MTVRSSYKQVTEFIPNYCPICQICYHQDWFLYEMWDWKLLLNQNTGPGVPRCPPVASKCLLLTNRNEQSSYIEISGWRPEPGYFALLNKGEPLPGTLAKRNKRNLPKHLPNKRNWGMCTSLLQIIAICSFDFNYLVPKAREITNLEK